MAGIVDYLPTYASYNWTGAPADYTQVTNFKTGGDSSTIGFGEPRVVIFSLTAV